MQGKYKQDHDNLTQELAKVKLNGAIDSVLTSSKVRNTKAFKALLDMDTIKLDESGKLSGLHSQIESIRKSDPYLFDAGQKSACLYSRYDFNWIPRFRRGDELCILHSPSSEYFTCINLFSNGNS